MKLTINEAHVTQHFMERLSERIPVEVKRSDALRALVISNFQLLQKLNFPVKYSFAVTLAEISPFKKLTAVIRNDNVTTFIISGQKGLEDLIIISNLPRFASQYMGFLKKSRTNPNETFTSKFFDNGRLSFIMVAKQGKIIEVIKK